jgi:hypothetical protein
LNGLLEDKFDPSALLERAGRKYLDIIWCLFTYSF